MVCQPACDVQRFIASELVLSLCHRAAPGCGSWRQQPAQRPSPIPPPRASCCQPRRFTNPPKPDRDEFWGKAGTLLGQAGPTCCIVRYRLAAASHACARRAQVLVGCVIRAGPLFRLQCPSALQAIQRPSNSIKSVMSCATGLRRHQGAVPADARHILHHLPGGQCLRSRWGLVPDIMVGRGVPAIRHSNCLSHRLTESKGSSRAGAFWPVYVSYRRNWWRVEFALPVRWRAGLLFQVRVPPGSGSVCPVTPAPVTTAAPTTAAPTTAAPTPAPSKSVSASPSSLVSGAGPSGLFASGSRPQGG